MRVCVRHGVLRCFWVVGDRDVFSRYVPSFFSRAQKQPWVAMARAAVFKLRFEVVSISEC